MQIMLEDVGGFGEIGEETLRDVGGEEGGQGDTDDSAAGA